ncbi:MAG: Ig-like domain-containing protein [Clostridia bacterium]|nr:Ig-like domain-containing protein [Clostridia bacterium]
MKRFLYLFLAMAVLMTCAPMTVSFAAAGDQTTALVNVAAGKAAEILTGESGYGSYPFENVNDGKINSSWGGKITGGGCVSFVVDLGRQYAIDEIVVYDRHDSPGPYRTYFELSGSDTKEGTYTAFYTMHESADDTNFPAKGSLAITSSTVTATDNEGTVTSTTEGGFTEAKPTYRYIKYRCTYSNGVCWVGELIVNAQQTTTELADGSKVINPNIYGADYSAENKAITLHFSDEMAAESVNKNSVKLNRKSDNAPVNYTSIVTVGSEAVIKLPAAITATEDTYTVAVDATVKNASGVALAEAKSFDVTVTADAEGETPAPDALTVTKRVNVAKYKPVINVGGLKAGSATNINNDLPTDRIITPRTAEAKGAIGIDLQRRFPIEQVVLYDYQSANGTEASAARAQFEILGGDTKNIDEATVIFTSNDTTNESFVANGRYVANIPGAPAYRYVYYRNLVTGAACALREMEVFSTVQATEISRNAATYTTNNFGSSTMTGDKAVDGAYNDGNSLYLKTLAGDTYYNTLTVDLGSAKNVDMIEIFGRPGQTYNTANYHGYFGLYGSDAGTITDFESLYDETKKYGEIDRTTFEGLKQKDGETKVYTQIALQTAGVRSYTTADGYLYDIFPDTTLDNPRSYQTMVNRETPFRYLTHRKTATNGAHMTYIGEFIAYQFKPEVYSLVNVTADSATVAFSDLNMSAESLLANITVSGAAGVIEGAVTGAAMAEGSADAVLTFDTEKLTVGQTYTLTVGADITNTYGVALAEGASFTFVYGGDFAILNPVEPAIISNTGANTYSFTLANNSEAEADVFVAIALYNADELLAVNIQKQSVAAGALGDFSVSATNASGKAVTACKTFIWNADTLAPIV